MAMAVRPITRTDLREELALLRDEFRHHSATKADLADVRGDIKALKVLVVSTISVVGLVLAGLNVILQLIG